MWIGEISIIEVVNVKKEYEHYVIIVKLRTKYIFFMPELCIPSWEIVYTVKLKNKLVEIKGQSNSNNNNNSKVFIRCWYP